jgi:F-type H+-transporting ATPase subunit b
MKLNLAMLRGFLASASMLVFAVAIRAAEEGTSPAERTSIDVYKWIHFAIVLGLAIWLCKKVMPKYIRSNADRISAAINKATAARAEAERQLKEAAAKLTQLEQEIVQFRNQAQRDAAAELERLRGITKIEIEKVSAAAKVEIEAAERAARVELKALAAKLAMDRAESLVSTQMTPAVQETTINSFVQTLQGRPN